MSHYEPDTKWHEMVSGGYIPQAGNAVEYDVSGWRTVRPVRDDECCIDCLFCWVYCPDNAVICKDGSVTGQGIDLMHCKGCGICAAVCPKDCIEMVAESELGGDDNE